MVHGIPAARPVRSGLVSILLLAAGLFPAGAAHGAAPAADACVQDIDKVIATKPTAAMATASLPADVVASLDAALRSSFKQTSASGAIVGIRTPEGTWTAAIGKADPASGAPMEVGMHTRIGSLTKTFTGTLLLQLVQDGKLSLDDPIAKYVPGVPNGERITLLQLADMTSGVASYTLSEKFTDKYFAKPEAVFTPEEVLAVGLSLSPLFEPGARFDYSNTNTILLGLVIEKVTGQKVSEVFAEKIFEPLKLRNTSWPGTSTEIPEPFAQGFTMQGDFAKPGAPSNATHWNAAWGWTAGEVISDVTDLLDYGRALGTGQGLLDPKLQAERLTFPAGGGYGIALGCIDGWVGHTGTLPGYNTTLYYDTTRDITVVVQANSDIPSGDCSASATLPDNDRSLVCMGPATRIFAAVSTALGHGFKPLPEH